MIRLWSRRQRRWSPARAICSRTRPSCGVSRRQRRGLGLDHRAREGWHDHENRCRGGTPWRTTSTRSGAGHAQGSAPRECDRPRSHRHRRLGTRRRSGGRGRQVAGATYRRAADSGGRVGPLAIGTCTNEATSDRRSDEPLEAGDPPLLPRSRRQLPGRPAVALRPQRRSTRRPPRACPSPSFFRQPPKPSARSPDSTDSGSTMNSDQPTP